MEKEYAVDLMQNKRFAELKSELTEMNPADIAALLGAMYEADDLGDRELTLLFRVLPKELAAEAFAYMDSDWQVIIINAFSDNELREVIDELYLDDTVDIIEEMPANVVSKILKNVDTEKRKQINELLNYPKYSAGSVMTTEFVYFHKEITVAEAFNKIRSIGVVKETIYTCYVTENRHLMGIITLLDMIVADPDVMIADIMDTNVISVSTHDDQESVANKLSKYDLAAIPVVDAENRIVGIVTFDDAIDVIKEETTEDMEMMAAISPSDKPYFKTSVFQIYKSRIPWLMLLMISATFTGMIINSFERALAVVPALTVFIPMLMDTGGNSGSQASVTVIRGLSLNEIRYRDTLRVIWKEMRVALLCGATLAVANFAKLLFFDRVDVGVAFVVCSTLIVTVFFAKFIGCSLPILAKRIGFDPAVMASPFITTCVDAISLIVYFQIATLLLHI